MPMASEFGQQFQTRVLALDNSVLEQAQQKRYTVSQTLIDMLGKFAGCSEAEITEIMAAQGISYLSPIYREFLLRMGKGAGWVFFGGGDYRYESLKKLKQSLKRVFIPVDQFPNDAFVFLSYQGCQYFYFLTDGRDDDPAVYMYDVKPELQQLSEHLSGWLLKQTENQDEEED